MFFHILKIEGFALIPSGGRDPPQPPQEIPETDGMPNTPPTRSANRRDRFTTRRPPERSDIYAGCQYFRICHHNTTLPKNQQLRAGALFLNHNPKTTPRM